MNVQAVTSVLLAGSTVTGLITSYALGKRGQNEQSRQQTAANRLAERAQAFDEMKAIVDEVKDQNARLFERIDRINAASDSDLKRQAERCRTTIDHLSTAMATLQGIVVSEIATAAGSHAVQEAQRHVADDHPEHLPGIVTQRIPRLPEPK